MASWRLGLTVALVLAGVATGTVAFAFPDGGSENCQADDDVSFWFDTSGAGGWLTIEKNRVRNGFDDWEVVEAEDGSQLVSSYEANPPQVEVRWAPTSVTWNGRTQCQATPFEVPASKIRFRADLQDSGALRYLLLEVATHEMGHAHGLGHTGNDDSWGGEPLRPMMSCAVVEHQVLTQDDWSALAQLHFQEQTADYDTVTANASFENGWDYWGKNGVTRINDSGFATNGTFYARLDNDGSYIYQTTRYREGVGSLSDDPDMDARVNLRAQTSLAPGHATFKWTYEPVDYPFMSSSGCKWDRFNDAFDANRPDPPYKVVPSITLTDWPIDPPTGSWQAYEAATWTFPDSVGTGDFRIWIENEYEFGDVYVDFARVRGENG